MICCFHDLLRPARGTAPTNQLKVSIAYAAGYKAVGTLVYAWPDAVAKARAADRVLRERLDRLGLRFDHVLVDEGQDLTPAHWQLLRALVVDEVGLDGRPL